MGILMEASEVNLAPGGYRKPEVFAMGAPAEYYMDTMHTISLNTREADFESIVEPFPISLKTYKQYNMSHPISYYPPQQPMISSYAQEQKVPVSFELIKPSTSAYTPDTVFSPAKVEVKDSKVHPPPKKKWIKEYLEEPKSPVRVVTTLPAIAPRTNGVVVRASPPLPVVTPAVALELVPQAPVLDFTQEHSRQRTICNGHGPPQIPSPPSVGSSGSNGSNSGSGCSNGSTPRAGTREVHNKLEKNRRAHLKECFELLKRQLPATPDDKKTSNLSILGSAIRYIQVLRRKERECEHEMERLAREKISAQQRLAALKRDVTALACVTALGSSTQSVIEDKSRDDRVNGQVLGIPISISGSPPRAPRADTSPPRTLNLSSKLRALPIQITPTTSQVVRSAYSGGGGRHNTLTLTTLTSTDTHMQNGHHQENGMSTLSTTLVHPAQIHLPLSQVVSSGGLVVGGSLQLVSAPGGALRVVHAPQINGVTESSRMSRESGGVPSPRSAAASPAPPSAAPAAPPPTSAESGAGGVVVGGLTPLVVSQSAPHLLHSHALTHKMVEAQMMKGSVTPLTVSAQYLGAATIVKPVVVVSGAGTPPSTTA